MPQRLAILADLHFSTPENQFPGQDLGYARGVVERALPMLLDDAPQRLLFVGDLTNFGIAEEYAAFMEVFGRFAGRIDAVAGNHEMVKAGLADFERHMSQPRARLDEWAGVPRLLLNTAIDHQDPHWWHGQLDEPSLELIHAMPMHGPLLIAMHHPIEGTVRNDSGYPMMTCLNGRTLHDQLRARRGNTILFTGHTHLPDVVFENTSHGRITYVAVPPLCFWPHGYLLAECEAPHLSLTIRRVIEDAAESPDKEIRDPAARLHREPPVTDMTLRLW